MRANNQKIQDIKMNIKIKRFARLFKNLLFGGIALMLLNFKCLDSGTEKPEGTQMPQKIIEVQKKHQKQIMSLPGVVGIGIGAEDGNPVIKVLVKQKTPELQKKIPTELEGFRVMIEEVGEIKAL
jgi:hypothetical protein